MADNNKKPAAMYTCDECARRKTCEMRYENERSKMVRCTDWKKGVKNGFSQQGNGDWKLGQGTIHRLHV